MKAPFSGMGRRRRKNISEVTKETSMRKILRFNAKICLQTWKRENVKVRIERKVENFDEDFVFSSNRLPMKALTRV